MALHQDWQVTKEDGKELPVEQVTHAILLDIRDHLKSIRTIARYFFVVSIIGLIFGIVGVFATLGR